MEGTGSSGGFTRCQDHADPFFNARHTRGASRKELTIKQQTNAVQNVAKDD
jgi:hypothetical protein